MASPRREGRDHALATIIVRQLAVFRPAEVSAEELIVDDLEHRDFATPPSTWPLLRLTLTRQRDAAVLTVAGEIDVTTTHALSEALADAIVRRPPRLVVDLTPTVFLACAGLSVLVAAHQLAGAGTCLVVVAGSRATRRSLRLTGVDRLLTVCDQLADARLGAAPVTRPLAVQTLVADTAVLVTATGGSPTSDVEAVTAELRQACELGCGAVLFDVSACTLPIAGVVGSVHAAIDRGRWAVRVLTADEDLRRALDAAGIAYCVPVGPSW